MADALARDMIPGNHPPEAMRRICMYCRAVMDPGAGPATEQVTHGVCSKCQDKSDDALDQMARDYVRPDTFLDTLFDGTKK
jgi:hypothetical protein